MKKFTLFVAMGLLAAIVSANYMDQAQVNKLYSLAAEYSKNAKVFHGDLGHRLNNLEIKWSCLAKNKEKIPTREQMQALTRAIAGRNMFSGNNFMRSKQYSEVNVASNIRLSHSIDIFNVNFWITNGVAHSTMSVGEAAQLSASNPGHFALREFFASTQVDIGGHEVTPEFLKDLQQTIESKMLSEMAKRSSSITGLSNSRTLNSGEDSNSRIKRIMEESSILDKYYKNCEYNTMLSQLDGSTDPTEFMKVNLERQIGSEDILKRMKSLIEQNTEVTFLYVPNSRYLFYITVTKSSGSIKFEFRSFKVEGDLPSGFFASSTGSWNVEQTGESTGLSYKILVSLFKPKN